MGRSHPKKKCKNCRYESNIMEFDESGGKTFGIVYTCKKCGHVITKRISWR